MFNPVSSQGTPQITSSKPSVLRKCASCQNMFEKVSRCVRCRDIFYCGVDCQIKDWPNHKKVCQPPFKQGLNHAVKIITNDTESASNSDWEKQYEDLIRDQDKNGVHPLHDDPEKTREVKEKFMLIFDIVPEENKQKLVQKPLFPPSRNFQGYGGSVDSTKPLNYIVFCGDLKALKKIDPYLNKQDYLAKGPFKSTFMHCLISGYEKLLAYPDDLDCAKFLLKKAPELAEIKNEYGTTPLEYAKEVLRVMENSSKRRLCVMDQHNFTIYDLQKLVKLLENPNEFLQTGDNLQKDNLNWEEEYNALVKMVGETGNHPVFGLPKPTREIKEKFMHIFDRAPEEKKAQLVRSSLIPSSAKVNSQCPRDSAKPLDYIIYCGDFQALKKIETYLDKNDYYKETNLFKGTLMHSLVSGFQKLSTSPDSVSGPLQCAQFLIEKAPSLKNQKNSLNTAPLFEAEQLLQYMYIKKNSSDQEYNPLIPTLEKIIQLLKK